MAQQDAFSEQYERTRDDFSRLNLPERAVFILEAAVSTLAHGIDQAGRAVADGLESIFREAAAPDETPRPAEAPGAAEPETAQQTGPQGRSRRTGPAKPPGPAEGSF